jgi:hypothetical protein
MRTIHFGWEWGSVLPKTSEAAFDASSIHADGLFDPGSTNEERARIARMPAVVLPATRVRFARDARAIRLRRTRARLRGHASRVTRYAAKRRTRAMHAAP